MKREAGVLVLSVIVLLTSWGYAHVSISKLNQESRAAELMNRLLASSELMKQPDNVPGLWDGERLMNYTGDDLPENCQVVIVDQSGYPTRLSRTITRGGGYSASAEAAAAAVLGDEVHTLRVVLRVGG